MAGGHACQGGGHVWLGGVHGRGGGHAWQERLPLQRTVRILLECIPVHDAGVVNELRIPFYDFMYIRIYSIRNKLSVCDHSSKRNSQV